METPGVNDQDFAQLIEFGFTSNAVRRALAREPDVERALEWLSENCNDPAIDDPLEGCPGYDAVMSARHIARQEADIARLQDELGRVKSDLRLRAGELKDLRRCAGTGEPPAGGRHAAGGGLADLNAENARLRDMLNDLQLAGESSEGTRQLQAGLVVDLQVAVGETVI